MLAKIKSIWASFKASILKRMLEMTLEAEATSALKTALSDVETEFNVVKDKIEHLVDPVVAKVEAQAAPLVAQVEVQVQAVAPIVAVAVKTDVAAILAKVKAVLAIVDAVPPSFDTYAAPVIKATGTDIEAGLTMFEKMLDLAGVKSTLWTEIVAVVKAL